MTKEKKPQKNYKCITMVFHKYSISSRSLSAAMKLADNNCVFFMYYNMNTRDIRMYALERTVMTHRTGQASSQ